VATLQNVSNIQFRVETLVARDRRKRIKKDEAGYYINVPVAVLGIISQNNTYYDVESFAKQMTDKNTYVNKVLSQGKLYGEYGHPSIIGLSIAEQVDRLSVIVEKNISHHIRDISTGPTLENGGKLVLASVKPHGPYKESLQDNFEDPTMNTAFSLRAITTVEARDNISYRWMRKLVTFDSVAAGGYAEAAKSYSPALEHFDVTVEPSNGQVVLSQVALESYTDTEINEIFGAKQALKITRVTTLLGSQASIEFQSSLGNRSFYLDLIRE
jgi:hypothetical protein